MPTVEDGVGAVIRQLREAAGVNQRELARRTGLAESTISRIELGHNAPAAHSRELILRALSLSEAKFAKAVELAHNPGHNPGEPRPEWVSLLSGVDELSDKTLYGFAAAWRTTHGPKFAADFRESSKPHLKTLAALAPQPLR